MTQEEVQKIKDIACEFLQKMTITDFSLSIETSFLGKDNIDFLNLNIKANEPQILIGQNGQTLVEIQRILKIILSKKIKSIFYLELDINDYKKKKSEYLKILAKDLADKVSSTKIKQILPPMSSHERRIIHIELANRGDISTESQGDKINRFIIINPR